ncbi:MAG: extracellular solute-binding protein, partial [Caldilineaceae bacterium]|nr:extracellular solute-binding protein [Caldilineaceae bacterium]
MKTDSGLITRRQMLQAFGITASAAWLAACAPAVAPASAPEVETQSEALAGVMNDEIGAYIAQTDASGVVTFPNGWGGSRIPMMDEQVAAFNSFYPNIEVKSTVYKTDDLEKTHLTSIAAGTPDNAIMLRADAIAFFVEQGALMPLDELIARDEMDVDAIFYKAEIDTRRWDSQVYGLPNVLGGTRHLYWWNQGLFEEAGLDPQTAPQTWADLDEYADIVRTATPDRFLLEHNHTAGSHPPLLVWLMNNNGSYISDDLSEITFNSDEGIAAAEWMLQFAQRQADSYELMAATEARRMDSLEAATWAAGRYLSATAGVPYFAQLAEAAPDLNYGVGLLPYNGANPDARTATPAYAGWSYCIPTGAQDVDAAWEWIKYTCGGQGQFNFMAAQTRPAVVRAFNEDPAIRGDNPWWDVVIADLEASLPVPVMPVYPQIRDLMYDITEEVLFEKKSPADALNDGAAAAQKILDELIDLRDDGGGG